MLVYAHRSFPLHVPRFLEQFERRVAAMPAAPVHDSVVSLLVDFGEAESAVADALLPELDEEHPELEPWRTAARTVADAFCASAARDRARLVRALERMATALAALRQLTTPDVVQARTAEGFTCYGLYPEQYIDAANRLATELRPQSVCCIGLRSIGSMLAQVVASALDARGVRTEVRTVRPRGDPYDRRIVADRSLEQAITAFRPTHAAIIDEGPGLSGSSLAAGADLARAAGVPTDRVVLLPAWSAPADALRSGRARHVWRTHPRIVGAFVPPCVSRPRTMDVSAGRWRALVIGHDAGSWPAVQPQHERLKFLSAEGPDPTIARFAGLGRYGQAKLARASALADAGFGPAPHALEGGFLTLRWIGGETCRPSDQLAPRVADYLTFLRATFASTAPDDTGELGEMLALNTQEALGPGCSRGVEALCEAARVFDEPRVAVDGRLLAHEWIAARAAVLKVDALDHHADDFFPGCRDIAWDVAGAIAELELTPAAAGAMVARYSRQSGDATIGRRLPFYRAAYIAYRLGYATLASGTLGHSDDGVRFRRLQTRYHRLLAALLLHRPESARC